MMTPGLILDIVYILAAIAIVVLFTVKGFIASLLKFGRTILAAVLTYAFGPILSNFLYNKWIFGWIAAPIADKVENFLNNTAGSVDIDGLLNSLPLLVQKMADTDAIRAKYGATVDNFGQVAEDFSNSVAAPLASLISSVLAYVAIFFVSLLLLKLLSAVLDKIFNAIPLLNTINRILGAVLGLLAAFLFLVILTWLFGVVVNLIGKSEWFVGISEGSRCFGFFQNLNFFKLFG